MSYEGYEQYLCTEGHLTEYDVWGIPETFICPRCSGSKAFVWAVDVTNGEVDGDDNTKPYPFKELEYHEAVCDMGYSHLLEPIRYVIPN